MVQPSSWSNAGVTWLCAAQSAVVEKAGRDFVESSLRPSVVGAHIQSAFQVHLCPADFPLTLEQLTHSKIRDRIARIVAQCVTIGLLGVSHLALCRQGVSQIAVK